jgi:ornithine cyclodeaminase/alanine dehydrogenase-like protein (mu-crystallin family)
MRVFSEVDVQRLLPMADAIAVLRSAFTDYAEGKALNQPRRRLILPAGAVLHSMAGAYRSYFGTKVYSTHPKHGAHFTFLLYDAATATPLAQFEADHLGQIRTGATSGLAADLLVTKPEIKIGLIGAGFQAHTQLEAISTVRRIREARVWSRHAQKRTSFADEMSRKLNVSVVPGASASEACAGADVIITATNSKDPVIEAEDVPAEAVVIAMGSNHPQRRELPTAVVQKACVVVDDADACRIEAGDLLLGLSDAAWQNVAELKNVVAGKMKAGLSDRLVVFKSVGLGLEDVAAASIVYERTTPAQAPADPNRATR